MDINNKHVVEIKKIFVNARRSCGESADVVVNCSAEPIVDSEDRRFNNLGIGATITSDIYIKSGVIDFKRKVWKMGIINDLVKLSCRI